MMLPADAGWWNACSYRFSAIFWMFSIVLATGSWAAATARRSASKRACSSSEICCAASTLWSVRPMRCSTFLYSISYSWAYSACSNSYLMKVSDLSMPMETSGSCGRGWGSGRRISWKISCITTCFFSSSWGTWGTWFPESAAAELSALLFPLRPPLFDLLLVPDRGLPPPARGLVLPKVFLSERSAFGLVAKAAK